MNSPWYQYPVPFSDLWVMDMKEVSPEMPVAKALGAVPDRTASFDGVDDVITVPLPSWAHTPRSLGIMWVDFWMRYTRQGARHSYLVDAFSGDDVELRWYIEGHGDEVYISLVHKPGPFQQLVRRWGPLTGIVDVWHHMTFTIRTTPVLHAQATSMLLVQSFFFLDFMRVSTERSAAETHPVAIDKGLSRLVLGGIAASRAASASTQGQNDHIHFFEGEFDDFRVWWRACTIATDPSACDPYSFRLPRLNDGSPAPSARRKDGGPVHLKDVKLDDIAAPIAEHLFAKEDPKYIASEARERANKAERQADGLILHLDFNRQPALDGSLFDVDVLSAKETAGVLLDVNSVLAPALCRATPEPATAAASFRVAACPNCAKTCTFSNFAETTAFAEESIDLEFYRENGWCQCFDPSKVMARSCECSVKWCLYRSSTSVPCVLWARTRTHTSL